MALPITVENVTITGAGTEDAYTVPRGIGAIQVGPRSSNCKMRTTAGGDYITLYAGAWRRFSAQMVQQIFYFEGVGGADVLEVIEEDGPIIP